MPVAKKKPSKKAPTKKVPVRPAKPGEEETERYVQKHPAVVLPLPGSPPPLLPNYEGKAELLKEHPFMTVALDYGAFMWLWRIAEAKALHAHTSATMRTLAPEQERVALHAVAAFREAAGTTERKLNDLSKGRKRVLKRV